MSRTLLPRDDFTAFSKQVLDGGYDWIVGLDEAGQGV
jgi:hypothetical protein